MQRTPRLASWPMAQREHDEIHNRAKSRAAGPWHVNGFKPSECAQELERMLRRE